MDTPVARSEPTNVFFDDHPSPILVVAAGSLAIRAANRAACERFGLAPNTATDLAALLADIDPTAARDAVDGIGPGGAALGPWRLTRRDGTVTAAHIRARRTSLDGELAAMLLIEDAPAEADLEKLAMAEMLRLAGDLARIGSWRVELENLTVVWSDETCAIFGMPPGTMPDLEAALGFFVPEDRARVRAAFERCATEGTGYDLELAAVTAQGEPLSLRAVGSALRLADGRIVAVQGAVKDLASIRRVERSLSESQRRTRELAEAMPLIVWTAEPDGTIDYASRRFLDGYGRRDGFELSRDWLDALHPDDRPRAMECWQQAVAAGEDYAIEFRIASTEGAPYRWHSVFARAERDDAGRIVKWLGTATDIHDRREAAAETRRLAARLGGILDSITDGFIAFDRDWRYTYVNHEAERLLGRRADDLLGRIIWEEFPRAVGSRFQHEYEAALRDRQTRRFCALAPGLGLWLDVTAYPSEDGLSVFFRDVSAQHAADERLRLLELAIGRINDVVMITEAAPIRGEGPRILFVNEAFTRQTGYTAREAIGRTPRLLQGPGTDRAALDRIAAALERQEPIREPLLNYRRDGSPYWVEIEILPLRASDGRVTHYVATQQDITERRRAEDAARRDAAQLEANVAALQRLNGHGGQGRALLDTIVAEVAALCGADGAAYVSFDGTVPTVDAAFGLAAPLAGQVWPGGLPAAAAAAGRARVVRSASGASPDVAVRALLEPLGDIVIAAAPVSGAQRARGALVVMGRPAAAEPFGPREINSLEIYAGAAGVMLERRQIEDQLRQAQRLEAVGQLTGGIAHDFNNLLTIILGNAELLADSLSAEQELRLLAEMTQTAAERGAELTSRLLAFARRQALDPRPTDVAALLRGMDGLLHRTLGEQVELEVIHGGALWQAMVDAPQLESAILNLCINARDAMPGGGRLTIETRNVHLDNDYADAHAEVIPGQYLQIAVSDTGLGMAPDVLARAFEPFFTTKPVGQGSGLGLSMVFGFAKQSRGHLKIYSEPGQGTTVKLYLPRAFDGEPMTAPSEDAAEYSGSERILVVEDDELVRTHVTAQLRDLGYRVVAVKNGPEALEALRQIADIDLLFTDVVMPGGLNGRQLAEEALRLRPGLPVLFTSGYTENAIVHHGRLDPGVNLLNKPYRRRDLATKVRKALSPDAGAGSAGRRPRGDGP